MDTINIKPTKENLTKVLKALSISNKSKQEVSQNNENLPRVVDVLEQWMKAETVLTYPEGAIDFRSYRQCPIKTLQVNICSTETADKAVLYKLHNQIRDN